MQKLQDSVNDFVSPPPGGAAKQRTAKNAVDENRVCEPNCNISGKPCVMHVHL